MTVVSARHTLTAPNLAAKKRKPKKSAPRAEPRIDDEPDEHDNGFADDDEGGPTDADLSDEAVIDTTAEVVGPAPKSGRELAPDSGRSIARLDPMQAYMREVQRHALLSPAEEKELAIKYVEEGDVDAARRLVTSNLRLVVKLAYEYRRAYKNIMDLVQEGNIGLMQAVKRYDPYRGVKLSSYAAWWIRAYMLRYILNNWRMVKIGTTQAQRKLFFNLNKEKEKLRSMGIEPSHAEIAKRLKVDEKDVVEMDKRLARGDASLDVPVGDSDGRQTTRLDLLPGSERTPDSVAAGNELDELVRENLDEFGKTLSGKDVAIFEKRITADEPLTLQQLGNEFGVSRERVRQLEARLHGKLRTFLRERLGDAVEVG